MSASDLVLGSQTLQTHNFQSSVPNVLTNIEISEMPAHQCAKPLTGPQQAHAEQHRHNTHTRTHKPTTKGSFFM